MKRNIFGDPLYWIRRYGEPWILGPLVYSLTMGKEGTPVSKKAKYPLIPSKEWFEQRAEKLMEEEAALLNQDFGWAADPQDPDTARELWVLFEEAAKKAMWIIEEARKK